MKPLLIDTNLLVLLLVGSLNPSLIGKQRRVRSFDRFDFARVSGIASNAPRHITVPNVLTEASNLLGSGKQEICEGCAAALGHYANAVAEIYEPSDAIARMSGYQRFGLADMSVVEVARKEGAMVLTSEYALHGFLAKSGIDALNIFHLKDLTDLR